jgi:hypothetical protein
MDDPKELDEAIEVAIDRTHKAETTFADILDVGEAPPVSLADDVEHRAEDIAELSEDAAKISKPGEPPHQRPPRGPR